MRHYVLTCGPLVVSLCGLHIHQGIAEVEHLPADIRITRQEGNNCSICDRDA